MATTAWRGLLTFGLVSVPIRLYAAARAKRIYLHQLHRDCHTRLTQPLFCPHCNRIVDRSEVIKGYEYETGQYVLVEGEDIQKITPESGKTMEILAFVPLVEVDPIYFESSFLALPEAEGKKGYALKKSLAAKESPQQAPAAQVSSRRTRSGAKRRLAEPVPISLPARHLRRKAS